MKQILMTALTAVAVLLSSCSKDDNGNGTDPTSPITGLEMPASSAEQPVSAGATVSIKGTGFTASDEIWFSTAVKASGEVKAEGVTVTATGLSFIAPAMDGETSVTLKQAGKSYPLGKMFFATKGENPLTEHVYVVKETDAGCEFLEYDLDKGAFKSVFRLLMTDPLGFVSDNRSNVYYVANDYTDKENNYQYLACCNMNEKKEVRMTNKIEGGYSSIGIIDNLLHMIRYDEAKGYNLVSIADDGKETLVKAFGQLPDQKYRFFGNEDIRFIYDMASKTIVVAGESEYNGGEDVASTILSFSLETGVITAKHEVEPNDDTGLWFDFAKTNTGVLLFANMNTCTGDTEETHTDVGKTIITYINPATLAPLSEVATLDCAFTNSAYVVAKNILLGVDGNHGTTYLRSYDLTTKNLKQVDGGEDFGYVFTMFY